MSAVKAIASYIEKTMNDREAELGGRMMKRLSSEGYKNTVALPISICDEHRDRTLRDVTLEVYDTFSQMQKAVGVD